jgi:hypothetical protein
MGGTGNLALELPGQIVDTSAATEITAPSVSYDLLRGDRDAADVQKKLSGETP